MREGGRVIGGGRGWEREGEGGRRWEREGEGGRGLGVCVRDGVCERVGYGGRGWGGRE